jgi:hypothetical protein
VAPGQSLTCGGLPLGSGAVTNRGAIIIAAAWEDEAADGSEEEEADRLEKEAAGGGGEGGSMLAGGGDGEAGLEEADPRRGRTPRPPTKRIHAAPAPPQRADPAPPPTRICEGGWAPVEKLREGESHGVAARKGQSRA